jgi:orotidine-5'-phosphate decarboxylase
MTSTSIISFSDRLLTEIERKGNPCMVGLDPRFEDIPESIRESCRRTYGETLEAIGRSLFLFNKTIIDLVAAHVPAVKPQIAFYEMYGPEGIKAYLDTIAYARSQGLLVIADVKRNDIGSTVEAYSQAYLGRIPVWNGQKQPLFDADAVTVNAYLGYDGIKPFLDDCRDYGKGIFVLVKTSNKSSADFQNLLVEGTPLYLRVAQKCAEWGESLRGQGGFSSVGVVVGATYPSEGLEIRKVLPGAFFLVPGYGVQGGKAEDIRQLTVKGKGVLVNSSRGIIHAYRQKPYDTEFGEARFKDAIVKALATMIGELSTR